MVTPSTQQQPGSEIRGTPRPKVAVVYTTPETVLDDIGRAMRLADYEAYLPKDLSTLLKINISWQHYYPACSTTPWQLEGVIKTLKADGYGEDAPQTVQLVHSLVAAQALRGGLIGRGLRVGPSIAA